MSDIYRITDVFVRTTISNTDNITNYLCGGGGGGLQFFNRRSVDISSGNRKKKKRESQCIFVCTVSINFYGE